MTVQHVVTTTYQRDHKGRKSKRTVVDPEMTTITEYEYDFDGKIWRETSTRTPTAQHRIEQER